MSPERNNSKRRTKMTFKVTISGVGGQGTLLASRLLAESGMKAGYRVQIGETYGMAQRGGPVMGHVQIGGAIYNPLIRKGEADVIIGFEPSEGVRRGISYLKDEGLALINTRILPPVEVISGMTQYPRLDTLFELLGRVTERIIAFDATALAEEAGDPIATNIVMIGALAASDSLPYDEEIILQVLKERLRPRYLDLNLKAFKLGKKAYNQNQPAIYNS
jgi:indolepyruvate ferredoxin oxidoreductase beta subunit